MLEGMHEPDDARVQDPVAHLRQRGTPLRIGIVSATYGPSTNGVAISTKLYADGLRSLGHDVRLFVPDHPQAAAEPGVYRLPSTRLGAPADYPILLPLGLRRTDLPVVDLDVLHAMHPFVAGRLALHWARKRGVPLVFTAHTQYHDYVHYVPLPAPLTRQFIRHHVRTFARQAHAVLVPGQAMLKTLEQYGYRGPVTLMPNPVEVQRFQNVNARQVRQAFGIPCASPLVLFLGRLAHEKNLELLLDAVRLTLPSLPDVRLLIVGDGPAKRVLERAARDLPVSFAGTVPHQAVPPYLAAADLFVSPSLSETGTPMTFLEAFAAGTPVMTAATLSASNDLVKNGVNGLTSEPDPQAFSRGMLELLQDRVLLRRLSEGALATAQRYDLTTRATELAGLYQRVVDSAVEENTSSRAAPA
jgi:1,2-diacylglycerol 3-alpha-glucosyltransferase